MAFDFPWNRWAILAELVKRLDGVNPQFGKTALEKFVYLLQTGYGIDCGYDFDKYSYGPFSSLVLGDLDQVVHLGCITIDPNNTIIDGYAIGYAIHYKTTITFLEEKAADFLNDETTKAALDVLVSDFGKLTTKDLDLRATIMYIERDMHMKHEKATKNELCRIVGEIKPKIAKEEIEQAIDELYSGHYIRLATNENR